MSQIGARRWRVSEWVWDAYAPYSSANQIDPIVSEPVHNRVSRGGGWADEYELHDSTVRATDGANWQFDWVGFRLVRGLSPNMAD